MKRISCVILILAVCVCSTVSAQVRINPQSAIRRGAYLRRSFGASEQPALTADSQFTKTDAARIRVIKSWDLGVFPGGTYVELSDVNDLGFAVGTGDLPNGETHTLGVALFGPQKGEWIDFGTLGGAIPGG
jgi:hypothetical protein